MNYQTYQPHPDLEAIVKFYWTLEVPFDKNNEKQKIIPDGCVEMTFNFADGIKRYVSDAEYVVHPCAMVMGQRTKSYFIEPLGDVDSFAICFYPYGFANFVNTPLADLVDLEIPIENLFEADPSNELIHQMVHAADTQERIKIIEAFLLSILHERTTIDSIVKSTVDSLIATKGSAAISTILKEDLSKRRKLERQFKNQIGISPKQLGRVIRLQTALNMMLKDAEKLTNVAYESDYFDQAHFIRDFKEFTGVTPGEFLGNEQMALSSLFYRS
ncbi:AraC family transcriptional regulator [Marinoscillum sp.]|uniref:AraC family transcriptional regulator n=1 Tax=Marinoscillum sp. TaxID=2024838 RepID=UPI003BA9A93A